MDISVVIVTSPFVSMPSTLIIGCAIDSLSLVGLQEAEVIIVMDGCRLADGNHMKKGRVTPETLRQYDAYHESLALQFPPPRFRIVRSEQRLGFAFAVKRGLELCRSRYALVAQHDRCFVQRFDRMADLVEAMERHPQVRYIGFPTLGNVTHDRSLHSKYRLSCLNHADVKIDLGDSLYLQPLIFWFDSQHLCHVERYLQIFRPFRSLPPSLFPLVGMRSIKDMLLKQGDFIEDKFGQAQRNLFIRFQAQGVEEETVKELFRWFGSYLCWRSTSSHPYNVQYDTEPASTSVMVSHLDARHCDLLRLSELALQLGDDKIHSKVINLLKESQEEVSITDLIS